MITEIDCSSASHSGRVDMSSMPIPGGGTQITFSEFCKALETFDELINKISDVTPTNQSRKKTKNNISPVEIMSASGMADTRIKLNRQVERRLRWDFLTASPRVRLTSERVTDRADV